MRMGRVIITTVILTVLSAIYGWVTCGWLFSWVYRLAPTSVWVPQSAMTGLFFLWVNLGNLVLLFFFVLIFARLYDCIPGSHGPCKGMWYGLFVWLLGILPGMFSMYMFMVVNPYVLLYWAVNGIVWLIIAGIIMGAIFRKKGECCCSCH